MSLGRRKARVKDQDDWVFNRVAHVYDARPAYPEALLEALAALAPSRGRVLELGAGIGHLSLPLCRRGFDVIAVEPALAMLERLRARAEEQNLQVQALHAAAEALPLEAKSIDLVLVADAAHFLDRELAGAEIARVLRPGGALALITCEFADTAFMRALTALIESATPRRPREVSGCIAQLASLSSVVLTHETFEDRTPLDQDRLERILRSFSFIGPAMNAERFAAFRARLHELPAPKVWARRFTLSSGHRLHSR